MTTSKGRTSSTSRPRLTMKAATTKMMTHAVALLSPQTASGIGQQCGEGTPPTMAALVCTDVAAEMVGAVCYDDGTNSHSSDSIRCPTNCDSPMHPSNDKCSVLSTTISVSSVDDTTTTTTTTTSGNSSKKKVSFRLNLSSNTDHPHSPTPKRTLSPVSVLKPSKFVTVQSNESSIVSNDEEPNSVMESQCPQPLEGSAIMEGYDDIYHVYYEYSDEEDDDVEVDEVFCSSNTQQAQCRHRSISSSSVPPPPPPPADFLDREASVPEYWAEDPEDRASWSASSNAWKDGSNNKRVQDEPRNDDPSALEPSNQQHQSPSNENSNNKSNNHDQSWRRPGQIFRAKLIKQDEMAGRHCFDLSDHCSIQRYHLVAEKVLDQFLVTREDADAGTSVRDMYLVGMRLSKFMSTILPTHKDFYSDKPELAELRMHSHTRWLTLHHYLEELSLIIDEEEHSLFVLRDLNNSLDSDEKEIGEALKEMSHDPAAAELHEEEKGCAPISMVLKSAKMGKQHVSIEKQQATPEIKEVPTVETVSEEEDDDDSWKDPFPFSVDITEAGLSQDHVLSPNPPQAVAKQGTAAVPSNYANKSDDFSVNIIRTPTDDDCSIITATGPVKLSELAAPIGPRQVSPMKVPFDEHVFPDILIANANDNNYLQLEIETPSDLAKNTSHETNTTAAMSLDPTATPHTTKTSSPGKGQKRSPWKTWKLRHSPSQDNPNKPKSPSPSNVNKQGARRLFSVASSKARARDTYQNEWGSPPFWNQLNVIIEHPKQQQTPQSSAPTPQWLQEGGQNRNDRSTDYLLASPQSVVELPSWHENATAATAPLSVDSPKVQAGKQPTARRKQPNYYKVTEKERGTRPPRSTKVSSQSIVSTADSVPARSERRLFRQDVDYDEEAQFMLMSSALDENRHNQLLAARQYDGASARRRGMHHFNECVRCLLE